MDFCEALRAMRMGSKVARYEWYGRIFFWNILEDCKKETIIQTGFNGRRPKTIAKVPAEDVLAKDWYVVT
uniref:Thoeris anti-defense 2-like domain-containing protein n=1 Tax=viral metagenome TaxID=1070528 RepID=A0A6M3LNE2_9ZZZZ